MSSDLLCPLSMMFFSTFLSLYRGFDQSNDEIDYFPTTSDKTKTRKILWYLSHFTYSNSIFLVTYFFLKIFYSNLNIYFICIAPISLSVNLNYFLILYPKRKIKLYELSYSSFTNHFMTTFIVLNEIKYINYYSFYDIFYYNYFILYGILITFLNYYIRNVWTYGILDLYSIKGWKLFLQFNIVSFISSLSLYNINLFYKFL
jgi:hypothetical protein